MTVTPGGPKTHTQSTTSEHGTSTPEHPSSPLKKVEPIAPQTRERSRAPAPAPLQRALGLSSIIALTSETPNSSSPSSPSSSKEPLKPETETETETETKKTNSQNIPKKLNLEKIDTYFDYIFSGSPSTNYTTKREMHSYLKENLKIAFESDLDFLQENKATNNDLSNIKLASTVWFAAIKFTRGEKSATECFNNLYSNWTNNKATLESIAEAISDTNNGIKDEVLNNCYISEADLKDTQTYGVLISKLDFLNSAQYINQKDSRIEIKEPTRHLETATPANKEFWKGSTATGKSLGKIPMSFLKVALGKLLTTEQNTGNFNSESDNKVFATHPHGLPFAAFNVKDLHQKKEASVIAFICDDKETQEAHDSLDQCTEAGLISEQTAKALKCRIFSESAFMAHMTSKEEETESSTPVSEEHIIDFVKIRAEELEADLNEGLVPIAIDEPNQEDSN